MAKSLDDLDVEIFIANAWCVEAEQVYSDLRRRGLSHRNADAIAGHSKRERAYYRLTDKRLDVENDRVGRRAESLGDLQDQVAVLARWQGRGFEVSAVLAKLGAALLEPDSISDR